MCLHPQSAGRRFLLRPLLLGVGSLTPACFHRALDDATYATLTSLVLFNNVEVVSALQQDDRFLPELFLRLERHAPDEPEWRDLVAFLQEFCNLSRHLQPGARQQLFGKLVQLNLYDVRSLARQL